MWKMFQILKHFIRVSSLTPTLQSRDGVTNTFEFWLAIRFLPPSYYPWRAPIVWWLSSWYLVLLRAPSWPVVTWSSLTTPRRSTAGWPSCSIGQSWRIIMIIGQQIWHKQHSKIDDRALEHVLGKTGSWCIYLLLWCKYSTDQTQGPRTDWCQLYRANKLPWGERSVKC